MLTTDHGEEHLERGQVGHASTTRNGHLHEELVRLPLIVWRPRSGASSAGWRIRLSAEAVPTPKNA